MTGGALLATTTNGVIIGIRTIHAASKHTSSRLPSGVVRNVRNSIVTRHQESKRNQLVINLRISTQQQHQPNQQLVLHNGSRRMSQCTPPSKTFAGASRRNCRGRRRSKATLSATSSTSSSSAAQGTGKGKFVGGGSTNHVGSGGGSFTTTAFREWKNKVSEILLKPRTLPIPRWVSPRHHSITITELLGHSSFILVATSYAVDDFLMLRCIAVVGSTAMLFFTYFHPHGRVLWLPFKWNLLFIMINSSRIFSALSAQYKAEQLSPEIRKLRDAHFYLMDEVDFANLISIAKIETHKKGDIVVDEDDQNRYVRFVIDGKLNCLHDGQLTYILEEGNFMSESGLHAGLLLYGGVESCCTIEVDSETVRVFKWDRTELIDLILLNSGLRKSLKAVLSWDIMRKLKAQRKLLESGIVDAPKEWTHRRHEQGQKRYVGILRNILSSPHSLATVRKEHLNKYRMIHHIDDEAHVDALKQCGWTLEEFERGAKFDDSATNDKEGRPLLSRKYTTLRRDLLLRMQK